MKTISIYDSLLVLGRGIGQVMFQNNALSGLLMLVGIFLNSWQLGVLAVGGNIISTLAACISGYGRDDIKNGLYGFNGTLIGIAVGVFMQLSLWSLLLMAVASCFSTWIVRLFSRQHSLPGFTAPFIFSVWILLGICTWITPDLLLVSETVSDTVREVDYVQAFCLGIGQVMFQENLLTGLFFLAGIGVNSWTGTFYTALGTLLPVLFAVFWGIDPEMLNMGLMGYNGVLCALALGGKTWKSFVWALCSVLLSVVLQFAGIKLGITTLTAPFVLSVWMIMIMQKVVSTKGE